MKRLWSMALLALGLLACEQGGSGPEITVYKSPSCGCCKQWVSHLQDNDFKVLARNVPDVNPYKAQQGVPAALASCHTALVDGYVIEGHVPAAEVKRLLRERPDIKGLAVPGMPIGSPGMEQGEHKEHYDVIAFDHHGGMSLYARY